MENKKIKDAYIKGAENLKAIKERKFKKEEYEKSIENFKQKEMDRNTKISIKLSEIKFSIEKNSKEKISKKIDKK
jgi:hypothetical protein